MVLQNGKSFETINNCRVFVVIVALLSVLCAVRAAPASHRQSRNSGTEVNSTKLTATCPLDLQVDINTVSKSCVCNSLKGLFHKLVDVQTSRCDDENNTTDVYGLPIANMSFDSLILTLDHLINLGPFFGVIRVHEVNLRSSLKNLTGIIKDLRENETLNFHRICEIKPVDEDAFTKSLTVLEDPDGEIVTHEENIVISLACEAEKKFSEVCGTV